MSSSASSRATTTESGANVGVIAIGVNILRLDTVMGLIADGKVVLLDILPTVRYHIMPHGYNLTSSQSIKNAYNEMVQPQIVFIKPPSLQQLTSDRPDVYVHAVTPHHISSAANADRRRS